MKKGYKPMKYDFESIMERRGHDALALDGLGNGWGPGAPCEGFDATHTE